MIQITKNNQTIELRNLQEQVLKNKQDIAQHYNLDRVIADWGIKIVGQVQLASQLPDAATYEGEYGDAYAVGSEYPYNFYIWTRADENSGHPAPYWFNYGSISVVGPQGPQGNPGPKGAAGRSPKINAGTNPYATEEGDLYINTSNGNLYQTVNGSLVLISNIMGPAGPQGKQGIQGPQGSQGPRGYAGAKGDPGSFIQIVGQLQYEDQLPSQITNMSHAYLIGDENELYVPIGQTTETAIWTNLGPLNVSTLISVDGDYVGEWNADTKVDKMDPENLDGAYVYVANENGDTSIPVSTSVSQNSIAQRTGDGNLFVATPTADGHAATKLYVDSNFSPKTNKTGGSTAKYTWVSTGTSTGAWTRVANGGKDIVDGGIPTYVQPGQGTQVNLTQVLVSGDPKFAHDVATKGYVDSKVTSVAGLGLGEGYLYANFYNEAMEEDVEVTFYLPVVFEAMAYVPNSYVGQWDNNNEYKLDSVFSNDELRIYEPGSGEFWITKDYWFDFGGQ